MNNLINSFRRGRFLSGLMMVLVIAGLVFSFNLPAQASDEVIETDLTITEKSELKVIENPGLTTQNSESPSVKAKDDFATGGKGIGSGFKNGVKATGRAFKKAGHTMGRGFKKAGTTMGRGFKKAGSSIKNFFVRKKSNDDVQKGDFASAEDGESIESTGNGVKEDLDAVGNDAYVDDVEIQVEEG